MSLIKKIGLMLAFCGSLAACRTPFVPEPYRFRAGELNKNPYGCWMIAYPYPAISGSMPDTCSGELICMDKTSVYLLVRDSMVSNIKRNSIYRAELFTHRNQSGNYLALTIGAILPGLIGTIAYSREYGGGFLALSLPAFLTGIFHYIRENSARGYILKYPSQNSLYDLNKFARFPSGLPPSIDLNQLTFKY